MVDVNVKGVLHGIGAALPVFRAQGSGHFVTVASTAAFRVVPTMAVYAGTRFAVRAICEGLRQEAGESVRVTTVSPGPIATEFAEQSSNSRVRAEITKMRGGIAIPPDAIARAIAFRGRTARDGRCERDRRTAHRAGLIATRRRGIMAG